MHSATEPKRRVRSAKIPSLSVSPFITSLSCYSVNRRERREQLADLRAQCVGNLDEVQSRDVSLSPFDAAVIGAVDVSLGRELLLRKVPLLAQAPNPLAQQNKFPVFHRSSSLPAHGFSIHGL